MTLPSDLKYLRQVIMEEFQKLGITPSLEKEEYGRPTSLRLSA
jgi:hypothetical protein